MLPAFDWTTAVAATQPPKNSTSVEASIDFAGTGWRTWWAGSTVNVDSADEPEPSNDVIRTEAGSGPGLATTIHACHPLPPPCGQNHAPVAGPATAASDERTPTCVSSQPDTAMSATTATTATRRRPTRTSPGGG